MTRDAILQQLLNLFPAPAYLEVGVATGTTFHAVKARTKVAVDPKFALKERPAAPPGCTVTYHEVTSDRYFGTIAGRGDRFDVIYLDGLHTFEQTLRDLVNALTFLSPQGVIVVDDVLPSSYPASLPDQADRWAVKSLLRDDKDNCWMGDVYKLVFFVESFFQQFSFATTSNNHGQLVMWHAPRADLPTRAISCFGHLQFVHCVTERAAFRMMHFDDILAQVKAAR